MTAATKATSLRIVTAIQASVLSDTSKQQYLRRLEILAEQGGHADIWSAILAHKPAIAALRLKYAERHASLHMYSTAVLSAFKHVPALKEKVPAVYAAWLELHEGVQEPLELHALTAKPTDRQALGWVPFEEIVAKRDALPLGSDARLLLAMYTEIPSRRNDYGILPIYGTAPAGGHSGGRGKLLGAAGVARKQQGTPGSQSPRAASSRARPTTLTLNEYKTSKKYNTISEDLPESLIAEIRASLARKPRGHLFVSPRDGRVYKSEAAFSKMDIARRMGHSVETQGRYKFIFKPEEEAAV
ncbi:MAG: hypothetical protein WDW38_006688 [Sanguina aurantia]